ncbi:30S ribosomal protein S27ae [Thermococcus sp.]|uniref:30S ribosomal protein S27ae n=1 Tax=Thermococcus sp. TaxID=35749 RepID=UPI0025DC56C0|nr:30S ribosomal protein S27ae [Thermococcus sp.]
MGKGKKKTSQKWRLYEVQGRKIKRKNRFCPRCGPGVFMADHGNRWACGRCGYTEWKKK